MFNLLNMNFHSSWFFCVTGWNMKKEQQQLHFVRFISIKVKRGLYNIFKIVERIMLLGLSYIWGEKRNHRISWKANVVQKWFDITYIISVFISITTMTNLITKLVRRHSQSLNGLVRHWILIKCKSKQCTFEMTWLFSSLQKNH